MTDLKKRFCFHLLFLWPTVICQADALSGLNTTLVRCPPPKVTTPSPVANATAAAATKTTVTPTRTARIIYLTTVPQRPDTTPSNDDDGSSEEEAEGGKGSTRPVGGRCPPGTSYYGIFQLSDRIFCDSGRKPTRNLCRTPCSGERATGSKGSGPPWWVWAGLTQASGVCAAFSDDDPTDDIRCIIQTGYWR